MATRTNTPAKLTARQKTMLYSWIQNPRRSDDAIMAKFNLSKGQLAAHKAWVTMNNRVADAPVATARPATAPRNRAKQMPRAATSGAITTFSIASMKEVVRIKTATQIITVDPAGSVSVSMA